MAKKRRSKYNLVRTISGLFINAIRAVTAPPPIAARAAIDSKDKDNAE